VFVPYCEQTFQKNSQTGEDVLFLAGSITRKKD